MGMLKVFAGIASLLAIVLPSFVLAKSYFKDKRYICLTSQATGWEENGEYIDLDLSDPKTQYIIEPMEMIVKKGKYAQEGYIELHTSHTIKQLGLDDTLAVCMRTYHEYQMDCYSLHGDLKNKIGAYPMFIMHSTQGIREPIFMTRINIGLVYFPKISSDHDDPVLEVGECKKF